MVIATGPKRVRLRAALLASSMLMAATPAIAVDATWNLNGAGEYNVALDWTPATVPDGTATFGVSTQNVVHANAANAVGRWIFNAGASAYTFNLNGTMDFNGAGIVINGGSVAINNGGVITFFNTSTAGSATINNDDGVFFLDNSSAGSATIIGNGGGMSFEGNSTAGNATITNNNFFLFFRNTSTAGNATITNNQQLSFEGNSTAGSATITNNNLLGFGDNTTAGNASITNNNVLDFGSSATAGSATITNNNVMRFFNSTTAGSAAITNNNVMQFFNTSTAGSAAIINSAAATTNFASSTGPNNDNKLSAGSIAGGGLFVLGSNELTVGGNNLSTSVSGVVSGAGGALVKLGTGTLTLSNTNTYTGATTVNAGTLAVNGSTAASALTTVNAGGMLMGTGTVGNTSVAGGVFAPGSGTAGTTQTVDGTLGFSAGGIYRVFVNSAAASSANITGVATLTGGTANAQFASGSYLARSYTILTAGTRTGTFSGLSTNNLPAGFSASLGYGANTVMLNLAIPASGASGLPPNQQGPANAIADFFNNGGALPPGFVTLVGLTGQAQQNGYAQVSGEGGNGATQTSAYFATNQFMNVLLDQSIDHRDGDDDRGVAAGYADESPEVMAYTRSRADAGRETFAKLALKAAPREPFAARWSVWAAGYGGSITVDGNAAAGTHTTTSRIYGTSAGADYRIGRDTLLGFAMGGAGVNFNTAQGLGGGRADMFQLGLYGRHNFGAAYIAGALAYGWQDVTIDRTVTVAGADHLRADFDTNTFAARAETGYRFAMAWAGVTPYAAVQATTFHLPSYAEAAVSGSNQFALAFASQTTTNVRSELGIRTDKSFAVRDGQLTLRGRAAWAHDSNTDRFITPTFQALPGSGAFVVNGAKPSADGALVTAGAEMKWRNGWSVAGNLEGEFSRTTESYAGKGTVKYAW